MTKFVINEHHQSEKELENNLIKQLEMDGYAFVNIKNEDDLLSNLRRQLEIHNKRAFSEKEFNRILLSIQGKGVFESARTLRNKQVIKGDDGRDIYVELFNTKDWCKNEFQVTNQIIVQGKYKNRYDVTILINGLPLVQIELKRRGLDFKEAFNQIRRYKKHSFTKLFHYLQFFVISNGVDTKYFANIDGELSFEQTFFWSDIKNKRVSNLKDFAIWFLGKCNVAKMIARYMVVDEINKTLMILRPYQVYAVEELMTRGSETNNNGYVWHTTGSGKTLTSFKLCKLISSDPRVSKVIFLVDRRDLDNQTIEEFNKFDPNSVDSTESADQLVEYLSDSSRPLLLTTIQKMSIACNNEFNDEVLSKLSKKDNKIIFIIDECHRSQFGEMHKVIERKFPNAQYFGFTGTPRFTENPSTDGRTTADVFEKLMHSYLIKDAISDGNVLGFNVDYIKTINSTVDLKDETKVEAIDTEEVIMNDKRIEIVAKDVLSRWKMKTRNGMYNAIFTVKNIPMLLKYYNEFKKINSDNIKIAAIYTFAPNGDDGGGNRDELEIIINDYNKMFDTQYSTNTFGQYFQDVSKRIKNNQINILLVVNMFLTGFDAKCLNTLFVDKRLRNHELIQAFSRTNRIEKFTKPYGNIVLYQTTKHAVDTAIKIFSKTDNADDVLMQDFDYYIERFKKAINKLKEKYPDVDCIEIGNNYDQLKDFVLIFRELIRVLIYLTTFLEFDSINWIETFDFSKQDFEDYKSKYLTIDRRRNEEKVSILQEIDFCIDFFRNDKINVTYILKLLQSLVESGGIEKNRKTLDELLEAINNSTDRELRLKSDLIMAFINNIIPALEKNVSVEEEFDKYLEVEKEKEISEFSLRNDLPLLFINELIGEYQFSNSVDANKIKSNLSKELVMKIKEEEEYPSAFKVKAVLAERTIDFVRHITDRYQ